jgi:hypothetical protein
LISLGTGAFFAVDQGVKNIIHSFSDVTDETVVYDNALSDVIFTLFGLNKGLEDYIDMLEDAAVESRKAAKAIDDAFDARIRKTEAAAFAQKELNELIEEAQRELNDPKRLESIENSPEIQAKVAKEQKRLLDLRVQARLKEIQDERKETEKKQKEDEKSKKKSIKTIKEIGDSRKKEFIKRLQEESKRGGAGGVIEKGSIEEAEIKASLQNRDAGKLSQADTLQKQFDAEEKIREDEKLKIAKETLEAIKKQKAPIKVRTGSV